MRMRREGTKGLRGGKKEEQRLRRGRDGRKRDKGKGRKKRNE